MCASHGKTSGQRTTIRGMSARIIPLRPPRRAESPTMPARLLGALRAELQRCPPKPPGLMACVAWLQQPPEEIAARQMAVRSLGNLRDAVFVAPGREGEMRLLWREALATACFARLVAAHTGFDAPLLTSAGLLHRLGELAGLRALASAEIACELRLVGPVMQQIMDARHDELVARVTRTWGLAGELRLTLLRWRDEQESLNRPRAVTLLMMAQALATGLVHAATCTPGLVDAARQALGLPAQLPLAARELTPGLQQLLDQVAPV